MVGVVLVVLVGLVVLLVGLEVVGGELEVEEVVEEEGVVAGMVGLEEEEDEEVGFGRVAAVVDVVGKVAVGGGGGAGGRARENTSGLNLPPSPYCVVTPFMAQCLLA